MNDYAYAVKAQRKIMFNLNPCCPKEGLLKTNIHAKPKCFQICITLCKLILLQMILYTCNSSYVQNVAGIQFILFPIKRRKIHVHVLVLLLWTGHVLVR